MSYKSKNGFTLVELLAVIIIIAVILVLTVGGITSAGQTAKEKIYQSKVTNIENAAVLYGQDNFREETITVSDLVDAGYLTYDIDGIVTDPRGKKASLNDCNIDISINSTTRVVTASMDSCD